MPCWMRRRERPDYSHLHGRTLNVILDAAIANRPYGRDKPRFPAEVNDDLISWFSDREVLTAAEVLSVGAPARTARGWSAAFTVEYVGTRVGWGLELGLLVEEEPGPDGERAWTMPDWEPQFDVHRGRARRIRGLPPNEQFLMDRRRAREAKLRATLDAKHARRIAPRVAELLDRIITGEPDATMPAGWSPYVGADVMERWPRAAEVYGILRELHHGMDRERQREWLRHLQAAADATAFAASRREGERQAAAAALLVEDAGAFEGL